MDRLISLNAVLSAIGEWIAHREYDYTNATEYLRNRIRAIPSAEPYKGMTNGEVIQAVFPNVKIRWITKAQIGITYEDNQYVITNYELDWWNSPYEPQESEDKE